ncbi:MAG: SDR family NAD(P)-dependent oxidoreductase [Cognaticolwellia sp.]
MRKTILLTGATDGIGLATAKLLTSQGHNLLIHGRDAEKLAHVAAQLSVIANNAAEPGTAPSYIQCYLADLSQLSQVRALASKVLTEHQSLDVLINNAGVFKTSNPIADNGLDLRFMVNTIAPFLLTQQLAPLLGSLGRVINLSSAAQAPVNIDAIKGKIQLTDMQAYAQSKLAITLWTQHFAKQYKNNGPTMISVNPGSLLASKMVKEGFGVAGHDINIGAKVLSDLALNDGMEQYSGQYFDNDIGQFTSSQPDGISAQKAEETSETIAAIINAQR